MNVTDYNQRISNLKADFREQSDKARKDNENLYDNLRDTHKLKEKRQRQNYDRAKAKLEKQNYKNSEFYNQRSAEVIEQKKKDYFANLKELQEDFREVRVEHKKDTDIKLEQIKNSYRESLEAINDQDKLKVASLIHRQGVQLDQKDEYLDEMISNLKESSSEKIENLDERYREEQNQLIVKQDEKIRKLELKNRFDVASIKSRAIEEKESLQEVQKSKIVHLNERIGLVQKSKNDGSSKVQSQVATKIDELMEDNKTVLNDQKRSFRKIIKKTHLENSEDKRKVLKRYTEELANLDEAYHISHASEKIRHQEIEEHNKERYVKKSEQLSDNFENKLDNFIEGSKEKFKKFQENNNDEKRSLIADHKREQNELVLDGNIEKNHIRTRQHKDIQALRDTHVTRINELQKYQESMLASVDDQKQKDIMEMQKNFKEINENLAEKTEREEVLRKREFTDNRSKMERKFYEDIKNVKVDFNRRFTGRGGKLDQAKEREQNITIGFEKKVDNLKKKIEDIEYVGTKSREKMALSQKEQLSEARNHTLEKIREKDDQLIDFQQNVMKKTKEESQQTIDLYKQEIVKRDIENNERAVVQRNLKKNLLERNRVSYGNIIKRMNEDSVEEISRIQDEFSDERSDYIQNVRKTASKDRIDLKEDLLASFARKSDSYEKQLQKSQDDNKNLTEEYEKKISNLEKNVNSRLKKSMLIENERREADMHDFKLGLSNLNQKKDREASAMQNRYEKKIFNLKNDQDMMVENIIGRYEDQLIRERSDLKKDSRREIRRLEDSLKRQDAQFEYENDVLAQKHEIQIDNLHQKIQMISTRKNS